MTSLFTIDTKTDSHGVEWYVGSPNDANPLLAEHHYLGPLTAGGHVLIVIGEAAGNVVAAQVWRNPTSRHLPADGTWLELSRWCLTPEAGENAGSRNHKYAVKFIQERLPDVTTLVSYSDPSHGHTGALYRACNWEWRPTWLRLRTPPTGNGSWSDGEVQQIKDRWVFPLKKDVGRERVLGIDDAAAIRHWAMNGTRVERGWARTHPQLREVLT